jgi:hypothetical protein
MKTRSPSDGRSSGKTPNQTGGFFAVRQGKGGLRACIFLEWEDCKLFVEDLEDDEVEAEFSVFDKIKDAISYAGAAQPRLKKKYGKTSTNSGSKTRKRKREEEGEVENDDYEQDGDNEESGTEPDDEQDEDFKMGTSPRFKLPLRKNSPRKARKVAKNKAAASSTTRKRGRSQSPAVPKRPETPKGTLSEAEDTDATPASSRRFMKPNEKWKRMFNAVKEYKDTRGKWPKLSAAERAAAAKRKQIDDNNHDKENDEDEEEKMGESEDVNIDGNNEIQGNEKGGKEDLAESKEHDQSQEMEQQAAINPLGPDQDTRQSPPNSSEKQGTSAVADSEGSPGEAASDSNKENKEKDKEISVVDMVKWMETQRYHYRLMKEGKKACMNPIKIEKLESIGFDFKYCSWDDYFEKIRQVKDDFEEQQKQLEREEQSTMETGNYIPKPKETLEQYFDKILVHPFCNRRYDDTADDDENDDDDNEENNVQNGDTNSSAKKTKKINYSSLGKWFYKAREQCRLFLQGKPANITKEQMEKLFALNLPSLNPAKLVQPKQKRMKKSVLIKKEQAEQHQKEKRAFEDEHFEKMFRELVKYKQENGTCHVPKALGNDLSKWVISIKNMYRRLRVKDQENKPGRGPAVLTAARIQRLHDLGFVFAQSEKSPYLKFHEWVERLKVFKEETGTSFVLKILRNNDVPLSDIFCSPSSRCFLWQGTAAYHTITRLIQDFR